MGSGGEVENFSSAFRIPMRGYELREITVGFALSGFRIPMWGYETNLSANMAVIAGVPNPHEGL